MKEYRIEIKVRNNVLLYKIEQAGHKNINEFCRANNVMKYCSILFRIISMTESPLYANGEFRNSVTHIAELLNCSPADLFSDEQLHTILKTNKKSIQVNEAEMRFMIDYDESKPKLLEDIVFDEDKNKSIKNAIGSLLPREKIVIDGIMDGKTKSEIAQELGVTIGRVRKMENKAIRRLRHPQFADKLRTYYDEIS